MNDSATFPGQANAWQQFYAQRQLRGRYPTEWVVRTLAGANYPEYKLDKNRYRGARILDMSCGDGRNLPLLLDLGFEVHATEISDELVHQVEQFAYLQSWPVKFAVGRNCSLPYDEHYFDAVLCSSSCYYLDGETIWPEVRVELARVLKPSGLLIANFPDPNTAILQNAIPQPDGSLLITDDPFGIRNGSRFIAVAERADLEPLLAPEFHLLGAGHQNDDFYGLRVSAYMTVSERL